MRYATYLLSVDLRLCFDTEVIHILLLCLVDAPVNLYILCRPEMALLLYT
jgi:hypothetical protein